MEHTKHANENADGLKDTIMLGFPVFFSLAVCRLFCCFTSFFREAIALFKSAFEGNKSTNKHSLQMVSTKKHSGIKISMIVEYT